MASHDPTPFGPTDGPRSPEERRLPDRPDEFTDDGPESGSLERSRQVGDAGAAGAGVAGLDAEGWGAESPGANPSSVDRTFTPYSSRPPVRRLLVTFLFHHNPFYLLSALCMIAGCYGLNAGLQLQTGEVYRILLLIGTLAVYELMLVALGLFLIRGRGLRRDGRTLLLLQLVFLVDLTFLNAETVTADLRVGIVVNAALLLLAWGKVGVVLRVLSPGRFPARILAMAALVLAVLFAMPCWLRAVEQDGWVSGNLFHLSWWVVGLLAIAFEVLRHLGGRAESPPLPGVMRPRLGGLYVVFGYASVIAHLGMMHWVYGGRFHLADLIPVLLGLGVLSANGSPTRVVSGRDLVVLRLLLPVGAVLCALVDPRPLDLAFGTGGRFEVRSIHLALVGAYLVYVYAFLWRQIVWVAVATTAVAVFAWFGPTAAQMRATADLAWARTMAVAWTLLPKTMVQWGMTAVAAAFAFLGLGAIVSLRQGKQPTEIREEGRGGEVSA